MAARRSLTIRTYTSRTACLVKQIELCRTIAANLQALQASGDPLVKQLQYAVHEHLRGLLKAVDDMEQGEEGVER